MADLTLKQAKDYVRSKVKELKNDAVIDNMLTIDFNLAVVKVQGDLMEGVGIKEFIKTAYLEGSKAELPADIMPVPNAIRDIRASAGVKAYISTALSGNDNDCTFTAVEPGTPGNGIQIVYVDNGTNPLAVYSVNLSTKVITIGFDSSLPDEEKCASLVVTAINNHILASTLVTAALKTGNDGTGPIAAGNVTLANGTGAGWKPADEKAIKDSNRIEDNYIEAGSVSFPKYVIKGDADERKIIEFYPKSIVYSEITYFYTINEMDDDTDTLGIPLQFRELVLIEVIRKAYEALDMTDKMATRNAEYEMKLGKIYQNYQQGLNASIAEKKRIQTDD